MFTSYFSVKSRVAFSCAFITVMVYPNGYDNRYFPFTSEWNSPRTTCEPSHFYTSAAMYVANKAFQDDEDDTTIPEIFGVFDEQKFARAYAIEKNLATTPIEDAVIAGNLPVNTELVDLPWYLEGKIEGQAINFHYEQHLFNNFAFGISGAYMHIFSRQLFSPSIKLLERFNAAQLLELDRIRRMMQDGLGIQAPEWSGSSFSDIDMYIRYGHVWDYVLKNKRIDAGVRFGALIPSGLKRYLPNPASVPFGGNGIAGLYGAFDAEFELKEDWRVGFLFRFSQRFSKIQEQRLPRALEQPLYAATVAKADIKPGMTLIFSPYARIDGLQDGLGLQVRYTLVHHEGDFIRDTMAATRMPPATLRVLNRAQEWQAEVVSATLLYDFAAVRNEGSFSPTIIITWDIPVKIASAQRVSATNRLSCGFNVTF